MWMTHKTLITGIITNNIGWLICGIHKKKSTTTTINNRNAWQTIPFTLQLFRSECKCAFSWKDGVVRERDREKYLCVYARIVWIFRSFKPAGVCVFAFFFSAFICAIYVVQWLLTKHKTMCEHVTHMDFDNKLIVCLILSIAVVLAQVMLQCNETGNCWTAAVKRRETFFFFRIVACNLLWCCERHMIRTESIRVKICPVFIIVWNDKT